jgi:subtilase family serine protease
VAALALGLGLALGLTLALAPGVARAAPRAARLGQAPRMPPGAHVLGPLPSSSPLALTVALAPRDPAGLADYARAVSTPGSPDFHRYLTVAQFAARFGASPAALAAVRAYLRARGLAPGAPSANHLSLPVRTTAGAASQAFATPLERVALRGGRIAYRNTEAPELAPAVAGLVVGVLGLDDLARPRPLGPIRATRARAPGAGTLGGHPALGGTSAPRAATAATPRSRATTGAAAASPCASASAAATAYSGSLAINRVAGFYGFGGLYSAGDYGQGQTVAVYELEGNFPADIAAYESCFGISAQVSYQAVDGGPAAPSAANSDGLETELDVENIIGLAPAAHVIVYQGPDSGAGPYDTYSAIISADQARVVSTSWGVCEAQLGASAARSEATLFEEAATQGQTVVAAAGDDGAEDCGAGTGPAVDDPASQPYVTGVGGTSVASLSPRRETVWNDGTSVGAGGGGDSALWPMPNYQASAPLTLHVINAGSSSGVCGASSGQWCREVPDVAADADPNTGYVVYYDGNGSSGDASAWTVVGGTSGAAPVWAALFALANATPACASSGAVGFANPKLYGLAGGSGYASYFYDVTSGNNDMDGSNGGAFAAATGYDEASGLGTPVAAPLALALCGQLAASPPTAEILAPASGGIYAQGQHVATRLYCSEGTGGPGLASCEDSNGLRVSGEGSGSLATGRLGTATYTLTATSEDGQSARASITYAVTPGYLVLTANGGVHAYGTPWHGSDAGKLPGGVRAIALAVDPLTGGYWILKSNGGVNAFDAPWDGSLAGQLHGLTPVALAAHGSGYLILTANGGVHPYGTLWHGSDNGALAAGTRGVSLAANLTTGGYWILTSNGSVNPFDAPWVGSLAGQLGGVSPAAIASSP